MTDERKDETTPEPEPTADAEPTAEADVSPAAEATQPAPEPAPAPVQPPRRLVRRAEGKMLAGVCTGLAAYLGLDPVLVRVGFVLATILGGGSGLVAYIVLWLVMPMAPEGEPVPPASHIDWFDSSSAWRWTAIGLIIAAVFLLSNNIWHFRASLFWGLILLGVGVALWSRELHVRSNGDKPTPPATAPPPRMSVGQRTESVAIPPVRPAPSAPISSPQRRPPSALGRLVVGAAALAIGIAVLLDNVGSVDVTARHVLAILVAIIGLGLVVGAWWGRARWLIFPGVALAFFLTGVGLLPSHVGGNAGNAEWAPMSLDELRTSYRHGAGNVRLDLRNVPFDAERRTVRVDIAFGNLEVLVPEDVPVLASAHVRGGNIDLFGHETNGFNASDTRREPGDDKYGQLTILTDAGFGNTEIKRARPGEDVGSDFNFGPRRIRVGVGSGS